MVMDSAVRHSTLESPSNAQADSSLEGQMDLHHGAPGSLQVMQLAVVYLILICEPLSASVIFPFIAKAVDEMGVTKGDKSVTGYYVGFIESLFFFAQGCCVLQWGRLSDRIGRKPVLLIGLMGLAISMLCFGLSRSFTGLIASRVIAGMLSGNIGITKTMVVELSDDSNRAVAFSVLPIAWTIGATSGPLIGGSLQHVAVTYPNAFTHPFWIKYPYFLPCFVVAIFIFLTFALCMLCTKETLPRRSRRYFHRSYGAIDNASHTKTGEKEIAPLSQILTKEAVIAILNYGCVALLEISYYALLTVFLAVPIPSGGLGLQPQKIGIILATIGAISGVIQLIVYPAAYRRFGPKIILRTAILSFLFIFPSFALMHSVAKTSTSEVGTLSWWNIVLLSGVLVCNAIVDMGFSSIFVYIAAACPSPNLLGAMNGIAQTVISFTRAIGPAGATSLFSYSVEHQLADGYAVYWCFVSFSFVALTLTAYLPSSVK